MQLVRVKLCDLLDYKQLILGGDTRIIEKTRKGSNDTILRYLYLFRWSDISHP